MLKTKTTLIALLSAAVLTACGGGGTANTDNADSESVNDTPEVVATDARTKYVGTWTSGCEFENPNFYIKSTTTLRTQGSAELVGDFLEENYTDSNCTVPIAGELASDSWINTYTFLGSTKTSDDGKVVDKVRMTLPDDEYAGQNFAAVLYIADNKLWTTFNDPDIADTAENVDGEGFPNALDLDSYMTKVSN